MRNPEHILSAHVRARGNTDANRPVEAADGDRAVNAPGSFLKQNLKLACLGETAPCLPAYQSFRGMSAVGDLLSFK